MTNKSLALKALAAEALIIAALGAMAFLYIQRTKKEPNTLPSGGQAMPQAAPSVQPTPLSVTAGEAKSIAELAKTVDFRPDVDLVVFVIDTSASMKDDRDGLRKSINSILSRYKGRAFNVVNFANTAEVTGEPTRNLTELKNRIDSARDLGGDENSYLALSIAAGKAREKFKNPAIVLMTDAAPRDGMPGSFSRVTMDQAADAMNMANAELQVWAGFDQSEDLTGGAATTSSLYLDLLSKVKAGGKIRRIE